MTRLYETLIVIVGVCLAFALIRCDFWWNP